MIMTQNNADISKMTFREAMTELEGVVATLESNTLELEESMRYYERGVYLLDHLNAKIETANQQVDVLLDKINGIKNDQERDTTLS